MSEHKPAKKRQRRAKVALTDEQYVDVTKELAERKAENPDTFVLPQSRRSVEDLADYLIATNNEDTNRILPIEKRRYVIYLRKSTDDEAKQVRSLDDQRTECLELAMRLGVDVREQDILEESASAKISGNRPIFDDMILGFKTKKYHGLIS